MHVASRSQRGCHDAAGGGSVRQTRKMEELMSARSILDEKGRAVVTIAPQMTVRQAADLLHENRIGAVVIVDDAQRITGILSERDVVSAVARFGGTALEKPVSSIMTKRVHCCQEESSVNELMDMMSRFRARHIPVEKNGVLAGIVSIGDIVKFRIREIEQEAAHIKSYIFSG